MARCGAEVDAAASVGRQVAVLQDLPGPQLRVGPLKDGRVELKPGEHLVLQCGTSAEGDERLMTVSWAGLAEAVDPEDVIYLADGAIRLREGEPQMRCLDIQAHLLGQFREKLSNDIVRGESVCVLRFEILLANHTATVNMEKPRARHALVHPFCFFIQNMEAADDP